MKNTVNRVLTDNDKRYIFTLSKKTNKMKIELNNQEITILINFLQELYYNESDEEKKEIVYEIRNKLIASQKDTFV